uniref:RNA helicase n=1 Tax=Plectus sambesii TaxID=2011161 RepID=A0A914V102_9BILA
MKFKDVVNVKVAHDVEGGERTADVDVNESVDFASLLLSSAVREGLTRQGFKRPSPIQLNAIPVGKLGLDMVVQAKSGTGKTCVFSVLALEMVQLQNPAPQVVIVAPTREIATQIFGTVQGIGVSLKPAGLRVGLFIGGTSLMQDKAVLRGSCQVIVGTPGRLCQLVQSDILSLGAVRLFVLDEADKLMEESYQQNVKYAVFYCAKLFSLTRGRSH